MLRTRPAPPWMNTRLVLTDGKWIGTANLCTVFDAVTGALQEAGFSIQYQRQWLGLFLAENSVPGWGNPTVRGVTGRSLRARAGGA